MMDDLDIVDEVTALAVGSKVKRMAPYAKQSAAVSDHDADDCLLMTTSSHKILVFASQYQSKLYADYS